MHLKAHFQHYEGMQNFLPRRAAGSSHAVVFKQAPPLCLPSPQTEKFCKPKEGFHPHVFLSTQYQLHQSAMPHNLYTPFLFPCRFNLREHKIFT